MSNVDFLSLKDPAASERHAAARSYAHRYVETFVNNPAGAQLLADWDQRLGQKRVPVNAPHTEYAAIEAGRAFIADIHAQIKLAQTEI